MKKVMKRISAMALAAILASTAFSISVFAEEPLTIVPISVNPTNPLLRDDEGLVEINLSEIEAAEDGTFEITLPNKTTITLSKNLVEYIAELEGDAPVILTASTENGLAFSMTKNGTDLNWYSITDPIIISIPTTLPQDTNTNYFVIYRNLSEEIPMQIVPRSWYANGFVNAKVYSAGQFNTLYMGEGGFEDTKLHWANIAINYMVARGVMTGVDQGVFGPYAKITGRDFKEMLNVTMNTALGIELSDPDKILTRQEMFVLLYDALGKMELLPEVMTQQFIMFDDWELITAEAATPIQNLAKLGLVNGSNGILNPNAEVTIAEAAQLLYNLLKYDMVK